MSQRILHSAVVADVISNPASVSGKTRVKMGELVKTDPTLIAAMPRNSILGILIDDNAGKNEKQYRLFLPFFSSHFGMPVKPGETVWVLFDKAGSTEGVGYWVTRKHSIGGVEDLNYTHDPRSTSVLSGEGFAGMGQPAFPKGGGGQASSDILSPDNDFEILYAAARATSHFSSEPVPRFSKRCGDLVLQGSNNARIVIGDNRQGGLEQAHSLAVPLPVPSAAPLLQKVGDKSLREDTHLPPGQVPTAIDPAGGGSGTIDIVAGSGFRTAPSPILNLDGPLNAIGGPPVPGINPLLPVPIIEAAYVGPAMVPFVAGPTPNVRAAMEIPRDIANDNPHEGDPDFETDLARIYVSMRCNVDVEFGIAEAVASQSPHPLLGINLDPAMTTELADLAGSVARGAPLATGASCVVAHADRVRLIARAEGDIKIVKKAALDTYGVPAVSQDSNICMDAMGNIQISASSHIVLTGGADPVPPHGVPAPPAALINGEPYVLYSGLCSELASIYDMIMQLSTDLVTVKAGLTGCAGFAAPFAAEGGMAALAGVGAGISGAPAVLGTSAAQMALHQTSGVPGLASSRIFGE